MNEKEFMGFTLYKLTNYDYYIIYIYVINTQTQTHFFHINILNKLIKKTHINNVFSVD